MLTFPSMMIKQCGVVHRWHHLVLSLKVLGCHTQTESSFPLVRKVLTKFTTMAILTIWCLVTGNMTGKNMIDSHRKLGYISNYWLVKVFNLNVTEKVMMKKLAKLLMIVLLTREYFWKIRDGEVLIKEPTHNTQLALQMLRLLWSEAQERKVF